ncbi:MAG: hypothetical protein NT051_02320 [Candidatus Micrarchaeota archaeon]|nr:hypothetical protein [Candidatus Micrarchaeota archaeon]
MAARREHGKSKEKTGQTKGERTSSSKQEADGERIPSQKQANLEPGDCLLCGKETRGTPARQDLPIIAARKLRALFKLQKSHTIACPLHLADANAKRAKFEKSRRNYAILAAFLFIAVILGTFASGQFGFGEIIAALAVALFTLSISAFYYYPKFD